MIKFHFCGNQVVGLNKVGKLSTGSALTATSSPARHGLVPQSLDLRGLGTLASFALIDQEFLWQSGVCVFAQG
jgi:hypothetical protein